MDQIESLLKEKRVFKANRDFTKNANWNRKQIAEYRKLGAKSPERFWAKMARNDVSWFTPWKKTLQWKPPFAKWFVGGKLNVSYNCLDRHLEGENAWRRNKAAIVWEGEPGDTRVLTFGELHREVCRFANVLKESGVRKGDRVALYMPMIPELAIALLACARIGAPHSVVFGGFSAEALRDRINDAGAKLVVTADGGFRRGEPHALKPAVDEALEGCPDIERVIVVKRTGQATAMKSGRDLWWHDAVQNASAKCAPARLDSEHPLFILYTSGTTGKPKGILHTTGGYLTHVTTTAKAIFDLKDSDTYWCTADIGWITGHSYVVYGILANGATTLMYEGTPTHPGPDRFWDIIERWGVTVFYTAPTAIRTFVRLGDEHPKGHDLSSLRLLGTVGEPINPEAWMWYHRVIGGRRCPIVDTWWQTETGGIMITPLPAGVDTKPGSATLPFPGVHADVWSEDGQPVKPPNGGFLVIEKPWPGMLRGIWGDPKRFRETYWSKYRETYLAGDGAHRDSDRYFWIMGRIDDVMNISGHRIGTMEVESAIVAHAKVAESAVVGRPDELTGTAIVAFVTPKGGVAAGDGLAQELRAHVAKQIGPIAKPADIRFTDALPKTRSGKIMRRLLRDIAAGKEEVGDTTTLEDYSVLTRLRESQET
ncbi:MAG: acetate--CoA ligase [Myxococcota bacterium]|jgi:acetyl-CoA synthetase|nr:acetate--CoA ligase [Deltaproteobacteria bacterium]MCP4242442.1 acetate--CoA ligase [bacterium]MDP6075757.1 acetate--CoA ligase [Myxococcota bacterium]MBT40604.1 acetate--CoA ligase [Deltaproteobacteria bacterium]MDP6242612.1 acetate--CoA ligase [Myxococcota bacterium]